MQERTISVFSSVISFVCGSAVMSVSPKSSASITLHS